MIFGGILILIGALFWLHSNSDEEASTLFVRLIGKMLGKRGLMYVWRTLAVISVLSGSGEIYKELTASESVGK